MQLSFKLVTGEEIRQFVEGNVCTIGRSSKCDVVIPHEGMSRQHCQIEIQDNEVFVTDLGSTNGVLIDGIKIPAHQKTLYALFLPLAFGAVQSLQIDVDAPIPSEKPILLEKTGMSSPSLASHTKTRKMITPPVSQPPQRKKTPPKKAFNGKLAAVIVVILIAGAVFLNMQDGEQQLPEETYDPELNQIEEIVE